MTFSRGFEHFRPSRLDEATAVLLEGGARAALLAGGTDLVPRLKRGQRALDVVVDLGGIAELGEVTATADGVRLGAMASPYDLARNGLVAERFPAVAEAARAVGAMQIRGMATLGGALASGLRCQFHDQTPFWRGANGPCLRDGGERCHATGRDLCVATQACDLPVALAALGARVEIRGPEGTRELEVTELQTGDGLAPLALGPGELVVAATLPWAASRLEGTYRKLRLRKAVDRPLLGLGLAAGVSEGGALESLRVAACGVGPAVRLAPDLEPFLGSRLDAALAGAIARSVARWLTPSPALRVDVAWRAGMGRVLVERGLEAIAKRAAARPRPLARETQRDGGDPERKVSG